MSKKVAVLLSGCGYLDGAEVRESVFSLLCLDQEGLDVEMFAPARDQHHTVDHLEAQETQEKRSILKEAARIARGKVRPLSELKVSEFDGIVLPGGFGVAKNFCTFAFEGAKGSVEPEIKETLVGFKTQDKPIAAICISPALIAMTFENGGFELTVGSDKGTMEALEGLGHKLIAKEAHEWVCDKSHKVVSTPAYMFDKAPLREIYQGIQGAIREFSELL